MKIICLYFPDWFMIHHDFTRKQLSNQFFTFAGGTSFSEWLKPLLMWMTWYYKPSPPPCSFFLTFDVPLLFQLSCPVLVGAVLPPAALPVQSSPLWHSNCISMTRVGWEEMIGRDLLIKANWKTNKQNKPNLNALHSSRVCWILIPRDLLSRSFVNTVS